MSPDYFADAEKADALRAELDELRTAVDTFLVAPKIAGQHSRALMRLHALSRQWKAESASLVPVLEASIAAAKAAKEAAL